MCIRTDFRNGVRRLRNIDKMQGWSGTEEDKCQMFLDYCEGKKIAYMMGELHNQKTLFFMDKHVLFSIFANVNGHLFCSPF